MNVVCLECNFKNQVDTTLVAATPFKTAPLNLCVQCGATLKQQSNRNAASGNAAAAAAPTVKELLESSIIAEDKAKAHASKTTSTASATPTSRYVSAPTRRAIAKVFVLGGAVLFALSFFSDVVTKRSDPVDNAQQHATNAKIETPNNTIAVVSGTEAAAERLPDSSHQATPATATNAATESVVNDSFIEDGNGGKRSGSSSERGKHTIQISSHTSLDDANNQVARLRSRGVEASIVKAVIPQRGTWYRIQAGRFATRAEAARYGAQLQAGGAAQNFFVTDSAVK